jgi:hypothetical protein
MFGGGKHGISWQSKSVGIGRQERKGVFVLASSVVSCHVVGVGWWNETDLLEISDDLFTTGRIFLRTALRIENVASWQPKIHGSKNVIRF